jgi:hypothetical protein
MMSVIRIPMILIPEVVSQEEAVLNSSSIRVSDVDDREKKKGLFDEVRVTLDSFPFSG